VAQTSLTTVRDGENAWLWNSAEDTAVRVEPSAEGEQMPSATPSPASPTATAAALLAELDPTTDVTVSGTGEVADRPTVDLVLTPRDEQTLVDQVVVNVDRETGVALGVSVYSVRLDDPAWQTAFTTVDYQQPASDVFAFAPPAGATVEERTPGESADPKAQVERTIVGEGWSAVTVLESSALPIAGGAGFGALQELDDDQRQAALGLLQTYLSLPTVDGEWGSGRLLSGTLASVIITDDGRVAVGAVEPDLLEAALGPAVG